MHTTETLQRDYPPRQLNLHTGGRAGQPGGYEPSDPPLSAQRLDIIPSKGKTLPQALH